MVGPGQHEVLSETVASVLIAPFHSSGNLCENGHFLPKTSQWNGRPTCVCGASMGADLGILQRDLDLISSPAAVLDRIWWHSSDNANLFDAPDERPVHLGSEDAARHRAALKTTYRYLYEVQVNPSATISPKVVIEDPWSDPAHSYMVRIATEGEVVRYLNSAEDAGGISLLANIRTVCRRSVSQL